MDNKIRTEKDVVGPDSPGREDDDIYVIYFWQWSLNCYLKLLPEKISIQTKVNSS